MAKAIYLIRVRQRSITPRGGHPFEVKVCVCVRPHHWLSPRCGGQACMFQCTRELSHLEFFTPGRVILVEQVCGEDLDTAWPNLLRAGEKWV